MGGAACLAVLLAVLLLPSLPLFGAAQQGAAEGKVRSGDEVVIAADETVSHDLYVTGGTVRIDGRIEGDLIVAGGDVEVNGPVIGDLLVAGGDVTVAGSVDGAVRVAGGNVQVRGQVRRDLLALAGNLKTERDGRIGQDLLFTAGNVELSGTVAGGVLGRAGEYSNRGTITATESVTTWRGPAFSEPSALERVFALLRNYLLIALAGALLLWLAPRFLPSAAGVLTERPFESLGIGMLAGVILLAVLIGLFVALGILVALFGVSGFNRLALTTALGGFLGGGLLAVAFILVMGLLAAAVAGLALGRFILRRIAPSGSARPLEALLAGAFVVALLMAIPVVGGIVSFVIGLLGLGAVTLLLRRLRREAAPAPA